MTRVLHLTLKKKWFDMIASGEKKEEYREFKPYWVSRLCSGFPSVYDTKDFDIVQFKNGYAKDAPTIRVKWEGCDLSFGAIKNWGGNPAVKCFIIKLGEIVN